MAPFNPTSVSSKSARDSQNAEDYGVAEVNPSRTPLFVPSDHWVPCGQVFTGYRGYTPLRYASGIETAALPSGNQHPDLPQRYEDSLSQSFMATLDPPAQHFTPEDQRGHIGSLESLELNATAPTFVPVKSSKLNAAAPSFLLSRLSIFHSPAGNLAERPRKVNLVLPNASDDIITDSIEMMQCPQDGQVGRYTSETTLEFNNGWHHNDPVLAAMYHILKAKKKTNFSVFATNHGTRPVDDALPLWPPHLNPFDIKCYYFKAKTRSGFWKNRICDEENVEWITILPNGSPPTVETIHIFASYEGKWLLFGDWLEKVSPPLPNWIGRTGYSLQFEWWKYSGSKRRFEDLPGEIRTSIYRYALGGEVYPMSTRESEYSREVATSCLNGRLTLGMGYNRWIFRDAQSTRVLAQMSVPHVPEDRPFVYEPALELLLVSPWMRDEVLHTGWEILYNCFFDPGIFHTAINSQPGPAMTYKFLSKVELAFTNAGWFDFLGVEISDDEPYISVITSKSRGSSFDSLQNLRDLRLRFRGLDDGYEGSPWGRAWWYLHTDPYVCCQRTIIDWICTFAYPFLKDKCTEEKVKVTLTGCVKTDTKTKWEQIFAATRDHDHVTAIAAILDSPLSELPPTCQCASKCSVTYTDRLGSPGYFRDTSFFDPR